MYVQYYKELLGYTQIIMYTISINIIFIPLNSFKAT